jgi:hypothetical protein
VGRLIYTPHPHSRVCPFGNRVRPPPLQHAPVGARARCRTHPRPDTCPHRNGCARIAFHPREDIVFVPVLPARAHSLAIAPDAFAPAVADARRVRARSHAPGPTRPCLESAPGPTSPRPILPARAHEHVFAPNTVTLLPAGARGRPVRARHHFPLASLAAACAPSAI